MTAGIFNAATSGERSARLREWLASEPAEALLNDVYRELASRDKGVAKILKEKLDEIKRAHGQEALASDWGQKAEHMLMAPRLNIADALAWQRDAAKAGDKDAYKQDEPEWHCEDQGDWWQIGSHLNNQNHSH